MKKNTRQHKRRIGFFGILLRGAVIAVPAAALIVWATYDHISRKIHTGAMAAIEEDVTDLERDLLRLDDKGGSLNEAQIELALGTGYDIVIDDVVSDFVTGGNQGMIQIVPQYFDGCEAFSALIAEDGSLAASSEEALLTGIIYDKADPRNGWYACDPSAYEHPGLDRLLTDVIENTHGDSFAAIRLDSVYADPKTHTFLPHTGVIEYSTGEHEFLEGEPFTIDYDDPAMALIETASATGDSYPRAFRAAMHGTKKGVFMAFSDTFEMQDWRSGWSTHLTNYTEDGRLLLTLDRPVRFGGETYLLADRFLVDTWPDAVDQMFKRDMILEIAAVLLIWLVVTALIYTKKKAAYAQEDFQRALTNDLAHDVKTPLMAIGGYAENLMDGRLTDEERKRYLQAIMDNVAYTDGIISRTLALDHMPDRAGHHETVALADLAEKCLAPYRVLLEERGIRVETSGKGTLITDAALLETAVENLISNAVKYTPDGGTITVTSGPLGLTVANSVAARVDVTDLKRPFAKGDASRTGKTGSGLGLSLADRAAKACRMKLKLSCTDDTFTAALKA